MPPDDPARHSVPAPDQHVRRRARPSHHRDAHLGGARGTARRHRLRPVRRLLPAPGGRRRRCGGRMWRWRRCIRNGAATATPGGATSTPSSPSNTFMAALEDADWLTSPLNDLIRRARGGEDEPVDAPAPGGRAGPARLPGARGVLRRGRDGLSSPISSSSARAATARRERASSIPSRPTAAAASATTTRRCCRRRCRRFRWR